MPEHLDILTYVHQGRCKVQHCVNRKTQTQFVSKEALTGGSGAFQKHNSVVTSSEGGESESGYRQREAAS